MELKRTSGIAAALVLCAGGLCAAPAYDYGDTGGIKLPLMDKPATVKFYVQEHPDTPFNKDWTIWKNLTQATNVDFNFLVADVSSFEQKIRLLYAADDLPDIAATRLSIANELGIQGGLVNIFDNLDKMPNYKKFLASHPDAKNLVTNRDGKSYYLPVIGSMKYQTTWIYRKDIFDKQSIKAPETTDQLYAALKKLKKAYPDVYPMINRQGIGGATGFFTTMAPQWATGYNMYFDEKSDSWKFGPIEGNYEKMLIFLNKLYKEQLLDPEWATLATKQWEDKLINGKGFVTVDWIDRIDSMLDAAHKVNPLWLMSGLMPIVEPGLGQPRIWVRYSASETDGFFISDKSSKKDLALRLMDFMYSPAGEQLTNFGKTGDTAMRRADGSVTYIADVKTPANPKGSHPYDSYYGFNTLGSYTSSAQGLNDLMYSSEEFHKTYTMYEEKKVGFTKPPLKMNDEERSAIAEIESSLRDFCDSQTAQFVVNGNFADWDKYVAKAKSLKIDRLVELYNKVYKESK